jgi:hypothetical protein
MQKETIMQNTNNIITTNDIVIKYADLLQEYERFLYESKEKVSSFWLDIQLWFVGKMMLYTFWFFTKGKLNEQINITPLNYNIHSSRKEKLKELLEKKNSVSNPILGKKLSWTLRSLIHDFSSIFSKIEDYTKRLEFALSEIEKEIENEIVLMHNVKEFDFDTYVQPPQNSTVIGSVESDESIDELLQLLTK